MTDPSPNHTLSLSADERHDCICDRFEAGWDAGCPPLIEEFLTEVPVEERAVLFEALLRVDLCRRLSGPDAVADYRARFPGYAERIDAVVRDPAETSPLDCPDPALRPPRINGYEVFGPLGRGGMGVVFRGRHVGLDRPVAMKMMVAGDGLARFEVEARAVAGLSHPNVVTVYDFGWEDQDEEKDARPYLVMEFVDGGSLAERLNGAPADPAWA